MGWGTAWRRAGACVVLCAAAALADNLRGGAASQVGDAVGEAARELGSSHDVCYQILDTWWADREGLKVRGEVSAMDAVCKTLSGQPLLCNSVDERKAAMAIGALTFTAEQMAARCTTVGAHDTSCVANPCNSVNTGDCHLQASLGRARESCRAVLTLCCCCCDPIALAGLARPVCVVGGRSSGKVQQLAQEPGDDAASSAWMVR
jgi:hypothetical protein